MDQQALFVIITVFAGISSVALVIQAAAFYGIYKAARALEENARLLLPKVQVLVETSRVALEEGRQHTQEITARVTEVAGKVNQFTAKASDILVKATDIVDLTRARLGRIDELLEDASLRARVQLDRAELVLDDTMNRAHETVALVHGGIMKPLREVQGLASGVRTAVLYLMRGGRPNPSQATSDEEMFI